jgi:hypothetical protein
MFVLPFICLFATSVPPETLPTPAESARNVVAAAKTQQGPFSEALSKSLSTSDEPRDIWQAVAPHTLIEVEINPEMRVHVTAGPAKPILIAGRPTPFFVRVENRCGATARLAVTATDLGSSAKEQPEGLDIEIVDAKGHSDRLSGAPVEYKLLMCRIAEPGRREIRLGLDAGQGTQDLGFRGVTDVLFHVRKTGAASSGD